MDNKELPNSIIVEQELLSQVFQNNELMVEAMELIDSKDFYYTKHQTIYEVMKGLHKTSTAITATAVIEGIGQKGLKEIGGMSYVIELSTCAATLTNFQYHVTKLVDYSQRRTCIKLARAFERTCFDEKRDINDSMAKLNQKLIPEEKKNTAENMEKMLEKTLNLIETRYKNGGQTVGMTCGIEDLDNAINGWEKKSMYVLAARPSMGKSTLAVAVADGVSEKNNVLLFSMEDLKENLIIKMLSAKSFIANNKVRTGLMDEREFSNVVNTASKIASRKLHIDDTPCLSYAEIEARTTKIKQQCGLDMIIVDYLQYMKYDKARENSELEDILKNFKTLAKRLDINVTLLSQLSRAPEQRADHRPILSDLRGSGGIEQEADKVLFLYRDEYYNKETEEKNILEVIRAKVRNGAIGTTKLAYLPEMQIIASLDTIHR